MMTNEIKNEEEKISLWSQIKEDFNLYLDFRDSINKFYK